MELAAVYKDMVQERDKFKVCITLVGWMYKGGCRGWDSGRGGVCGGVLWLGSVTVKSFLSVRHCILCIL